MPPNDRPAFELPLLLLGGFRAVTEALHEELARQGHPGARPIHGFALQAIGSHGAKVTEIASRLGVTKPAAAKTVASLEGLGYAERTEHPDDARAVLISRTDRGEDMLARSVVIFGEIRAAWAARIGAERLEQLEDDLELLTGPLGGPRFRGFVGFIS